MKIVYNITKDIISYLQVNKIRLLCVSFSEISIKNGFDQPITNLDSFNDLTDYELYKLVDELSRECSNIDFMRKGEISTLSSDFLDCAKKLRNDAIIDPNIN